MCPGTLPTSSAPSWPGAHVLRMLLQDWGVPGMELESVKLKVLLKGGHVQRQAKLAAWAPS